ncbi:hypothetical protein FB471_3873 [Amycolatopsis cihanbeyliensis]|uniref:PglY protein n=2 Tax=Amycolatopsis cihanbeyliensis TaxID=1128664 RepID=A0A542DLX4_AMYCI|nr:PglY protein [Amycolatopsis cihanbeyliensis]TQJ04092.1 hypothetical protein FB471_3873 [Amycolatopsis cihanbeyliensis]
MYLRDVLDMPESVHSGDFKIDLSKGFTATEVMVGQYVVTDQLLDAFRRALLLVRAALRDGSSHAAYLHGSFGSGKSHFLTVLQAILNDHEAARDKRELAPVFTEHDEWLRGRKFLMVPYHLVGATDLDSALLGGYVHTVREVHPKADTPPVYRSDEMLRDARGLRASIGDEKFIELLGGREEQAPADEDDVEPLDEMSGWTSAELDAAFAAPAGEPLRDALVSALLSGPMASYASNKRGEKDAFLPLENGLSVISRHAKGLGYDGVVLFLDELILWLQAHLSRRDFVNDQVSKLVKLIESGDTDRPVPIISLISRQRDLTQLIGADVLGADVKNLEQQVQYLAERFDTISLEDRNLPAIIKERVLKPLPGKESELDAAFARIDSVKSGVKEALLDANGATHAQWSDFRAVYPLSPALLNVLVALSGALQRERTGLKLLQDMLHRRRDDMKVGELIPLGDLWDVLTEGSTAAFTDRLRKEAEAAQRFHKRVRAYLEDKYGSTDDPRFLADERLVKTLLLASLAPDVSALNRLTGTRLAALNHGSLTSRTVSPGSLAVTRLREIQAEFGQLRSEGDEDPVFALHLSDLDIEPLLADVADADDAGARRIWIKEKLWEAMGVRDDDAFVCEREIIWRGSRRTAEFVFENVRDRQALPDLQFRPSIEGRIRFVLDYPFDEGDERVSADRNRVYNLRSEGVRAATIVWLPAFLSEQRSSQLGKLLRINYLLTRNRLDDHTAELSTDDRIRMRHQLQAQRDNLTTQLVSVLGQLYGIARGDAGNVMDGSMLEEGHVFSLHPEYEPRLQGGATFEYNVQELADGLFAELYSNHPDFDPKQQRKPVTTAELRTALACMTRAAEEGGRVVLERGQLDPVRRILHPLKLGEVHDGPLILNNEWRKRIDQWATKKGVTGDYAVDDIREWIAELDYTGLDKQVSSLIIAGYALLADRAWVYHGIVQSEPPNLDSIGSGWTLRAQELPSEEEFEQGRIRAGALFGASVAPVLFARNVARLAGQVNDQVNQHEQAMHGLYKSLERHGGALGLTDAAPRVQATRRAAELLASLSGKSDPTELVRTLAHLPNPAGDKALARTITSAPAVLDALDRTQWELLETLRTFTGRQDGVGDRAERLISQVNAAAHAEEKDTELGPVLIEMQRTALRIIQNANYREQSPPQPQPEPTPTPAPAETGRRTWQIPASVAEQRLQEILAEVQGEITDFAANDPDVDVVLEWRPVSRDGQG